MGQDIITRYLSRGAHDSAELKAAYVTACNAYEGTAFREAVCALSPRHEKLMTQAIGARASSDLKGAYSAWVRTLGPMPNGTPFMRGCVEDDNRRAAEYAKIIE